VLLPAREREPRDPHENFYWLQEDYLRETAATAGFAWTIFRPQIIYGAAWGVAMNPLIPIAAYAAVRRELGLPFSFTGGATYVTELVDPRILGSALAWAASSEAARNETFNITNGDICAWRVLWPALARTFGMQQGPDETMKIADYLLEHEAVWDAVVARHGLRPIKLLDLLGESHHYVDRLLRPGSDTIALPNLVSTIKLRQAGFGDCYDTADGLRHWIGVLAERRLVPPLPAA
jgi:nucleoside-diphosphate-sugar epimerase